MIKKLLAFFFLFCLIQTGSTFAGPVRGASITFKKAGVDTITATLTLYVDCRNSAPASPTIFLINCSGIKTAYSPNGAARGIDITNIPKGYCDYCTNASCGFSYGIMEYGYDYTIVLNPSVCCDYTLQYVDSSGRPSSLTTVGAAAGMMVQTHLNICKSASWFSGYLTVPPTLIYPANSCIQNNLGSGMIGLVDSFVYRLAPPLDGTGKPLSYKTGYSYKQPFKNAGSTCQFQLDSMTGDYHFNANTDYGPLAIIQEHWNRTLPAGKFVKADDVLIELDLSIINAPSNTPTVISKLNNRSDTVHICPNAFFCGKLSTTDADAGDTIKISWNNNIYGATFVTKSTSNQSYFCWRPLKVEVASTPYMFVMAASDNHVPMNIYRKTICIYVDSIRFKIATIDSGCGNEYLLIKPIDKSVRDSVYNIKFSPANAIQTTNPLLYKIVRNGSYTVSFTTKNLDDTFCVTNYSYPFSIGKARKRITSPDTTICKGNSITISAGKAKSYTWSPAKYLSSATVSNPTAKPDSTTKYYLNYVDSSNCKALDSVTLFVSNYNTGIGKDKAICYGDSTILKVNVISNATYTWQPTTGLNTPAGATTIAKPVKSTEYKIFVDDHKGCITTDSVKVYVNQPVALTGKNFAICYGDSSRLSASGGTIYLWSGDNTISNPVIANPWVKPASTQIYTVVVKDSIGCSSTAKQTVTVNKFSSSVSGGGTICRGDTAVLKVTGGNKYLWSPSNGLSSLTAATVKATPGISTTYRVEITDTNITCSHFDSLKITVDTSCVWPGDVNRDKKVDYKDVLYLGLGVGNSGPSRSISSIAWKSYLSTNWSKSVSGVNYKNLDCNGDGKIDLNDTMAIKLNYGLTHLKTEADAQGKVSDPPLYFKFEKDTFYAGDSVRAYLMAGNITSPVSNIYGIGCRSKYTGSSIFTNTAGMMPVCDFLCDKNNISFIRPDKSTFSNDLASVRTSGVVFNGSGKIAILKWISADSVQHNYSPAGEKIYARILEYKAIDNNGNDISLNPIADSAIVMKKKSTHSSRINYRINAGPSINIYPNPANSEIIVESTDLKISQISICNAVGQEFINNMHPNSSRNLMNVESLPAGFYFIFLKTEDGTLPYKILIHK
jgi:hypothetical protein